MTLVTANAYERVAKIERANSIGTGTVVEHEGATYCVTARHVLGDPVAEISVSTHVREARLTPVLLPGVHAEADVAVFEIPGEFALPDLPLPMTSNGVALSQDLFFLGFPYGLALRGGGLDLYPFVKKGTLSSSDRREDGLHIWFLDGANNPGFSGGPLVGAPAGGGALQFVGVVSGYRLDWQGVYQAGQLVPDVEVAGNSGIIIAYDVSHALQALSEST